MEEAFPDEAAYGTWNHPPLGRQLSTMLGACAYLENWANPPDCPDADDARWAAEAFSTRWTRRVQKSARPRERR